MQSWCERWNIKINEDKTQAIYFSLGNGPAESHLTLKGRNIPFVNHVKYIGVIFDRKSTWRYQLEMIEAKDFRTFIWVYSLFKSERLSANITLTLHKALIRSVMTYDLWQAGAWESAADTHHLKLQRLQNKILRTIGNFPRRKPTFGFQNCVRVWFYYKIMQAASRSHTKSWQWKCSQYWTRRSPTQEI